MKLSKNRLHKIKGKKNSSRKKNNFRKRKGKKSYENTKKRHKRTHNLRKKTLKIYVGGDETEQEKKERLKILDEKNNQILSKLTKDCNLPKLPKANSANNTTTSTYIHNHYPITMIRNQPVLEEYRNSKLYRIETSALGNCLYDSVVFGLLYARVGKWNNLQGWIPQQKDTFLARGNFAGNLRQVLQHYICKNSKSIIDDKIMSTTQLSDAFKRLGNSFDNKPGSDGSGYGESEEIQLLARMFDVCIYVYSLNENEEGTQVYNNTGATIIEKDKIDKCKKENTISIVHASKDHFQNVLAIGNQANPSTTQEKTRTRKLQQKTNLTPAEKDELQQEAASNSNSNSSSPIEISIKILYL